MNISECIVYSICVKEIGNVPIILKEKAKFLPIELGHDEQSANRNEVSSLESTDCCSAYGVGGSVSKKCA